MLRDGVPLSEAMRRLAESLGVEVRLLPASDDPVRTYLTTPAGELDFQAWFVARRHADEVTEVRYQGAEAARPAPGVLEAIAGAKIVFLAPSNPFVSIRPILAVPGIAEALAGKRVVAVSPLVGGKALRGPLAEMMASLGHDPGVRGLAALYEGIATDLLVDPADAEELPGALVAPIVMVAPESRAEVGRAVLEAVR
jgi:LPPG:FO 2-phospho-L-lactate transferase